MDPKLIGTIKVYPPLGIARVGNAKGHDDFVVGPEVIGGAPTLPDGTPAQHVRDFRSADDSIKRQAARFRIYAHLKDGSVQEITAADAKIEWTVAVANLKAGWYDFNQAMDLPDGLGTPARRRNRDENIALPASRRILDIVPSPQSIEGRNAGPVAFNDGQFWFKNVYLGELRTDADGRLLFLGGEGKSASFRPGVAPLTFANNVGWHDDVADGPVFAKVTFAGQAPIDAEPGYVAVTPPNYAPGIPGLITMDDTVREMFYEQGWIGRPNTTSLTNDVWPVFDRLTGLQWVNHGFFVLHGCGSRLNSRDAAVIGRLRDPRPENGLFRQAVLALFRDPALQGDLDEAKIPQTYGDGVDSIGWPDEKHPRPPHATALQAVTPTQFAHLTRWAAGDFTDDWPGAFPGPGMFADLAPAEQVANLERAALHDCLGAPFHPGIEITWVMRIPHLWSGPYRLKVLPGTAPAKQDFGVELTPAVCVGAHGPYDGVAAGALTRFLGVPWQTDGASCNSSDYYTPWTFLSMPTFWGARVPEQVLAEENYLRAVALNPTTDQMQIHKHFMYRADWLRNVKGGEYFGRISRMVQNWAGLGMVLPPSNPTSHLPADVRYEQGRSKLQAGDDLKVELVRNVEELGDLEKLEARLAAPAVAEGVQLHVVNRGRRPFRQGEV